MIPWGLLRELLKPFLPFLAGILLLGGVYAYGDHNGSARVQRKCDAQTAQQLARVREVASAWQREAVAHELSAYRQMEHRQSTFAPLVARAHDLPPSVAAVVVPSPVVGVLNDAVAATNATGPASQPAEAPAADTTLADLTQWAVTVLEIDRECRDRVEQWRAWYQGVRAAASSESGQK